MDYEKKYKQLHTLISDLYPFMSEYCKEKIEGFFPEIRESADERIKKCIIDTLKGYHHLISTGGVTKEQMITWLEKQGEQKPIIDGILTATNYDEMFQNCNVPKFNVGDWIVDKSGLTQQVLDLRGGIYTCTYNSFTTDCESNYHLWSIEDAKDGDVLAESKGDVILMFRGIGNTKWNDVIDYYCYYDCYRKNFILQDDVDYWGDIKNNQLKPATKEQRDLLFSKMEEAGYEWDYWKKRCIKK